jgi:hypothetical protein
MKLSKYFKIFGKKVKCRYDDLSPHGYDGLCIGGDVIVIDNDLADSGKEFDRSKVIVHEFLHATLDRVGWHQVITNSELEELLVENIARSICENFNLVPKNPTY